MAVILRRGLNFIAMIFSNQTAQSMPPAKSTIRSIARGLLFLALLKSAWAASIYTTPYSFTTLAGVSSYGSNDGANGRFFGAAGIAADASGNIYVADRGNHTIRKVTPDGVVSTFAGQAGFSGSADGNGPAARFFSPSGVAADRAGNVYVADTGNHTIRKITPTGIVTTLAAVAGTLGNLDGIGRAANFNGPTDLAIDPAGNVYVNDTVNKAIRKVTPTGAVSTVAGSPSVDRRWSDANGGRPFYYDRYQGLMFAIHGIAIDADGNVLVSDTGTFLSGAYSTPGTYSAFRKITPNGIMTNLPGPALGDPAPPGRLAVDAAGQLVVAAWVTLHRIAPDGRVTLLAGSLDPASTSEYFADGPADRARFNFLQGLTLDPAGNVFLTDNSNAVRKLSTTGMVTTVAGLPRPLAERNVDGTGSAARLHLPTGVALDQARNIYAIDLLEGVVRKITPAGVASTFAGPNRSATDPTPLFRAPEQLAVDPNGNVFVTDLVRQTVTKITPAGEASVFAGMSDSAGYADGTGSDARFSGPFGIAADSTGNIYVSDIGNAAIRRITPAGVVTTLAGKPGQPGFKDGPAAVALFDHPYGLAVDLAGNVYVAEAVNRAIRRITPEGRVTTVAGRPGIAGSDDGPVGSASFNTPCALAVDPAGNLFVPDSGVIRKISPTGEVSTIGGMASSLGSADGTGREARLMESSGIAVDATGAIYFSNSSTIRKGVPAGPPSITTQPLSQTVAQGANVQFSVTAAAVPAPTYQWFFNGGVFSGATTDTLSFANARASDVGEYTVVVTNELGSVTSNKATLTVSATAAPSPADPAAPGGGSIEGWFVLALLALSAARCLGVRPIGA